MTPEEQQSGQRKELCKLREELELHPGPEDLLGNPSWTIHDPVSNRFFRIGKVEFEILSRWQRTAPQVIINLVNKQTAYDVDDNDIDKMDKFLRLNFLSQTEMADLPRHEQSNASKKMNPANILRSYLFFKIPLIRPDRFLNWVLPLFRPFFTRTFVILMIGILLLSLTLIMRQWDSFISSFAHFFNLRGLLIYGAVIIFSKILHEFSHAITASHYGVKVTSLGVAILMFWPLLYTDTSDSWKLTDKHKRMTIAGAGIIAELGLAAVAGLLWIVLDDGPWRNACFLLASTNWITTILFNMNPFMRFDGYFIVSDYLNMENLQPRAFAYTGWIISELLFRFGDPAPEQIPVKLQKPLIIYSISTWIYRILIIASISMLVYHLLFKAVGILLLISQLYQSVYRPLSKKIKRLIARRKEIRPLKSNIAVLLVLVSILLLMFLPMQTSLTLQAFMEASNRAAVHAPEAGRIVESPTYSGMSFIEGQTMFRIFSPDLEYELKTVQLKIESFERDLAGLNFDTRRKGLRLILLAELEREKSVYKKLLERKEKLSVKASVNGQLELAEEPFYNNQWVAKGAYLGALIDHSAYRLTAFVEELDVHLIHKGSKAVFYPELAELHPIKAIIDVIEKQSATELLNPLFGSIQGGSIAVTRNDNKLIPLQTFYKITLIPEFTQKNETIPYALDGQIILETEKRSIAERFVKKVRGTLIRESVF